MKNLDMIFMTLTILTIFIIWECSTKKKKIKQIILGIPTLLKPHEMEMIDEDDYDLALQVQDNLSDLNLSPDHEPIISWYLSLIILML